MKETGVKARLKAAALGAISVIFRKNRIVFESNPEFSCNTYPVYRYLVDEKHIDEKFEIVWLVSDKSKYADCRRKNHRFLEYSDPGDPAKKKLEYLWTLATARALVYSNRLLGKYSKKQYSIDLMHGMPLKRTQEIYRIDDRCDNVVCTSDFFADNLVSGFGVAREKLLNVDFARNDFLFTDRDVPAALGVRGFDKILVWMPTFRQNRVQQQFDIAGTATGLPLINTGEDLARLDRRLRETGSLLIVKPHPAQAKLLADMGTENFRILTNADLAAADVQTNELLGCADALITDYSTVYYDFLLTGKPIGLTTDDAKEYTDKRGFFYDDPYSVLKGARMENVDALLQFITDVKNGEDPHADERRRVCETVHPYYTKNTAARIGDIILNKIL